jgi:hypothetical protein
VTGKLRLNPAFPACAQVARRLLAEVYGCKPGDVIPGEAVLLEAGRRVADEPSDRLSQAKAIFAMAMAGEIGGIFEQDQ